MSRDGSEPNETTRPDRLERLLDSLAVRIILSILILASLVPHPADAVSDLVFLAIFGCELGLRVVLFARGRRPRRHHDVRATRLRALSALSLVIDFVALLSFVPWSGLFGLSQARWLRFLRLLRMLLLIGYWAPTLRDSWRVLTRHDRMRQVTLLGLIVGLLAFAGAAVLSHIPAAGTDFNGDARLDASDRSFWPRLWWAFRQVQDPGNMVDDPSEIAVVVASLVLTVAGLFMVSFLIGVATDIVRELVELARNRPVGWKGHTVVVHAMPRLPRLLSELTGYYEKLFRRPQLVVADQADEPPTELRTGELGRVRWRKIGERAEGLVHHADVASARRVVILAKPDAPYPDAHAAATVLDVREANARAWVVVELLDPNNSAAARVAGGARTVIVSSEKLLGIWALASIRRPEQLAVAWDLLATRGGSEVYTCFYDADGLDGPGTPWLPSAEPFGDLAASAIVERRRRGRRARDRKWDGFGVIPIGVVYAREGGAPGASHEEGELAIAPRGIEARAVRALVAIADHFEEVQRLALDLRSRTPPSQTTAAVGDGGDESPPLGEASAIATPEDVLVCGFRPATVVMCAGLLSDNPRARIVVVMRHEASMLEAAQAFREHGIGGGPGPCFSGRFLPLPSEVGDAVRFGWLGAHDAAETSGAVTLVRADWTSERTLSGLEPGVAHVGTYDLVVLLGSHLPEYDGRNAIACLKIADLARQAPERFTSAGRVVVGIADPELGRRLEVSFARATRADGPHLSVLATEDLRALFVFQASVVPGWEGIFIELLGPGGKCLTRLPVRSDSPRARRFAELFQAVRDRGVLFAVELADERRLYASSDDQGPWAERDLRALWLVADEVGLSRRIERSA